MRIGSRNLRAGGLACLVSLMAGCSTISGLVDGDPDGEGFATPAMALAYLHQWLRVEATHSVVWRDGVPELRTSITATNTGERRIQASTAYYTWKMRVYSTPERGGGPVWLSEEKHHRGGPDMFRNIDLAPGGSRVFSTLGLPVSEILGDRPAGTYYFTAVLDLIDPKLRTGEFNAGEVDLPGQ